MAQDDEQDFLEEGRRNGRGGWWHYLREHGPRFLRQTQMQGLMAYRRGSKALATNALSASGVDLRSAGVAAGLTLLVFLAGNWLGNWQVGRVYQQYQPNFLQGISNRVDAKRALLAEGWISEEAAAGNRVILNMQDRDFAAPLYRWLEIEYLSSGMDRERTELTQQLRKIVSGSPRGWILVTRQITTSSDVYSQLQKISPATMGIFDQDAERKELFQSLLGDLVGAVQVPIRAQMRFNGVIQLATVFVGLFVLTAVVRRYFFITRLAGNWLGNNLQASWQATRWDKENLELKAFVQRLVALDDKEADAVIPAEVERLSRESTGPVYDVYWFLAGIMPSLGFIGTVVGMSASLMLADRLFVATDRQLAIGRMTTELGLAFDTTLVALLFGLLAGIPIAAMHSRERRFFRELTAGIIDLRQGLRTESGRA